VPLSLPAKDVSEPYVDRHGVLIFSVVRCVNGQEVVLLPPTSAELTAICVDGQGVASLPLPLENVSVSYGDAYGLLAETLVSLIMRNGVVLMLVMVAELTAARVDGQGVVSLSPLVKDIPAAEVDRHGTLVFTVVSSVIKE